MSLADGYTEVPPGKVAFVVTSLEMSARPAPRAPAINSAVDVRHITDPEPAWYRDLYRRVGEDWLWFSRLQMPDEELAGLIRHPQVEVYALRFAGHDEGLLELDFRHGGECELAFFGLTPRLIGQGAGRQLMEVAIAAAWSRPIRRFWVHTCTGDHPAALGFYMRSGFAPFRRQIEIADDPRLAGALPRSAAAHVPMLA